MAKNNSYLHYPDRPAKLTAAFARREYQKLVDRIEPAEKSDKPDSWLRLFADWDALSSYIGSEAARVYYKYTQDMSDKELEARDRYFSEKISPAISKLNYALSKAFLASRHKQAIAKRFGGQLIPMYETAIIPMDPVNTELGVRLSLLDNEYRKLTAQASVKVRGEKMNLYKARSLLFSSDEPLRKEAYWASGDWFIANHKKLADIFDKMVGFREHMAKNVRLDSYVDFAYKSRGRQGYGRKDVEKFRELVLKHLVPLNEAAMNKQAASLGKKELKPWDVFYKPLLTVPSGSVPVETQIQKAQALFEKVSPKLAGHFKYMSENGLVDLETRPNKQGGAYCIDFSDEGKAAILCNSTGDPDDIRTLTHEMGHAFQKWESNVIELTDLQWGTAELAEIYSMGMEFLSLPFMEIFFDKDNSRKFALDKWFDSVYTICYVCVVDEFQHWVYDNPGVSPAERDEAWTGIYSKYLPAIDFKGAEEYRNVRWYGQGHIFSSPFYYIDYALAELCAMQIGLLSEKDYQKTVRMYLKMCKLGGTKSFLEAVDYAGMRSPFSEKLIKDIAGHVKSVLV
ncbi:MAG TPA: M3 family oligoendopeptidase [Candidatus Saccharimonadales bacterium]|nr:M3 family oligoendopeptidase [Candidatus Saccharimonadales bacterium]